MDVCDVCYKIICKACGWIASDEEAVLVVKEILTKCPVCSWSPKEEMSGSID